MPLTLGARKPAETVVLRAVRSLFSSLTSTFLVELPGIEPGSYGIPSRLLRAQFAMPLLGSPGHANKPGRRSQSLLVSR